MMRLYFYTTGKCHETQYCKGLESMDELQPLPEDFLPNYLFGWLNRNKLLCTIIAQIQAGIEMQ